MSTYECPICYAINHASKLQCSTCGTVPSQYSFTGRPMNQHAELRLSYDIVNAVGCDRAERHRTVKANLRTVAADYYSSGE